jgi:ethanolamine-phosphate cytidylyltransferase/choline-phosphate cytidylyltransferase
VAFDEMFPLTNIKLNDLMFWAPHKPAAVLAKEYGDFWETPDRYGTGAWSGDDSIHHVNSDAAAAAVAVGAGGGSALLVNTPRSSTVTAASNTSRWHKRPRVYVDIVGDLFHFGHARLFERARRMGRTLVVGVHSDATVASYKRWPILTMEERIESVRSCRWVDEIIPNAPLVVTVEYMEEHGIDIVVHGDDQLPEASRASYGAAMDQGKYRTVPYTAAISTSGIIRRVLDRGNELKTKKEVNQLPESGASPVPPPARNHPTPRFKHEQ